MKKIKTINKLLSSLTLLSPLSGIGFNSQYQSTQKVITEDFKNSLNSFTSSNAETKMGDIYVNLDETGKIIQSYASGTGSLVIPDYVTQIANDAFNSNQNISSLDLSNATSLTTIGQSNFFSCNKLSGNIILPDSLTTIGDDSFNSCKNLTGDLVIPSSVTSIGIRTFLEIQISSLDLSNATSLTTIGDDAFGSCTNLTGDLVIPPNLTTIGSRAFYNGASFTNISIDEQNTHFSLTTNLGHKAQVLISGSEGKWNNTSTVIGALGYGEINIPKEITQIVDKSFYYTNIASVDLSQATDLTSIGKEAFTGCSRLTGNLVIPSSVTSIGDQAFANVTLDNLYFLSETPPTFGASWQPTLSGKVYVPSESAKETYLKAVYFDFSEDQIEIGLPPEPSPKKSNTGLILGLVFGLGIPILLVIGFAIWYLTKKKKQQLKYSKK